MSDLVFPAAPGWIVREVVSTRRDPDDEFEKQENIIPVAGFLRTDGGDAWLPLVPAPAGRGLIPMKLGCEAGDGSRKIVLRFLTREQ